MNHYKKILKYNLFKLLSLYNTDKYSSTYGFADREHWGWKTKEFSNGTLQGGVHSLSIAIKLGLFNDKEKKSVLKIIESSIMAVNIIRKNNGSMEEAYPQENSFCVTALVAFDLLSAIKHLETELSEEDKKRYITTVQPLIKFISHNNEEHAIISNHLATAVAAFALWNNLTNDKNPRYDELLQIIYTHQSKEGWYKEYEGADPGYQTLCTYYLFCAYEITKDEKLLQSLEKSAHFLQHFIHPDGTIGGLYGSRNTEVYYPAGMVGLASKIEDFALISKYLQPKNQHILPQHIDIGNFIPLLNAYAVAALYYKQNKQSIKNTQKSPFFKTVREKQFMECGIHLFSNQNYFSIINFKKGGTLKLFNQHTNLLDNEDGGLFGQLDTGTTFSTQQFDGNINFENKKLNANFYTIENAMPNVANFILLRLFSLTIFKSPFLGNLFKKFIVKMLMTGKNKIDGQVVRTFQFEDERLVIKESITQPQKCQQISHPGKSKAIHMASSGYFMNQNFENLKSELVEFQNV